MLYSSSWRLLAPIVLTLMGRGRISAAWTNLRPYIGPTVRPVVSRARFQRRDLCNAVGSRVTRLRVHLDREADVLEQIVGGERYEMNELPDSMMATTLFVGNLNDFVQDDDLSDLFQRVSSLQTVPACVVRKPDMSSLGYGFVSFPTVEEKEAAIIRFHGTEFRGRRIRVEEIKDTPGVKRVRIPEKMIAYVSGTKKSVGSSSNTIHQNSLRRVSRDDDVDRLMRTQPSKRKEAGRVKQRLSDGDRAELERAARKGFVTLSGPGSRRSRPLTQMHRSWCDARDKPQICVYKATRASRPVDQVVVDLAPLRLHGVCDDAVEVNNNMQRWQTEILTAASANRMQLCGQMDEFEEECDIYTSPDPMETLTIEVKKFTRKSWATKPIGQLPLLSLMFQGERSNAKAMAKALALLWDIPEIDEFPKGKDKKKLKHKGDKSKMKGLRHHRKRGGGHRQAWD